jgi:hypothetical protein
MRLKRKSKELSYEEKYEILQKLDSCQTQVDIAFQYDISLLVVSNIYEQRDEITNYIKIKERSVNTGDIERILYKWCKGCEKSNVKLTMIEIRRRALEFNKIFNGDPSFTASIHWVKDYMRRYNINQEDDIRILRPNKNVMDVFAARIMKLLDDEDCIYPNVYNVNYTTLQWRALPERTWIFKDEKNDYPQMYNDYVIVFLCSNVTGCHKLPVLIVGNNCSRKLNINASSTTYTRNASDWVDSNIFNMWFEKYFVESIREKERKVGRREKILLLINNAKWHYYLEDLNKRHDFIRVVAFPYNFAPLVEPMECGIIRYFKGMYRKELLQTLMPLPNCNTQDIVAKLHKDLILWDCCCMIQNAWSNVKNVVMIKAWDQILQSNIKSFSKAVIARNIAQNVKDILKLLRRLPGYQGCTKDHVKHWFQHDNLSTIVMKVYNDIVIRDFRKEILKESKYLVDDEAGPSTKRANIVSSRK